jgi:hypothetical protein
MTMKNPTLYCKACRECDTMYYFVAEKQDVVDWQNGGLIQNILPYLNMDIRELLISGICGKCFDEMFGEDK